MDTEKITEEEKDFIHVKCSRHVLVSGNMLRCFGDRGLLSVVNELYNIITFGDEHERRIARSILFKIGWTAGDDYQSNTRYGWKLNGDTIRAATWPDLCKSDDEIALIVKTQAELGEVLAQKAIIEIAKRKLNGNYKDVRKPDV